MPATLSCGGVTGAGCGASASEYATANTSGSLPGTMAPEMKSGAATTPGIEATNLGKQYGNQTALADLNLRVERGEVYGLIGPNGAGKTTTMRLLLDLVRPTAGSVRVLGREPRSGGAALRRRLGYLPGELHLGSRATGRQLLTHLADLSGGVKAGAIDRLAERLGLALDRPLHTLSKGNRQKAGLIQAFMHEPELLILDEPTSGLDPLLQQEFRRLVREAQNNGQTVFLSSHVLAEIEQLADRAGVLQQGRLIRSGSVSSLRAGSRRHVRAVLSGRTEGLEAVERLPGVKHVHVREAEETVVEVLVEGSLDALVKLLAAHEVRDLLISEPVLEDAVLDLYREDAA